MRFVIGLGCVVDVTLGFLVDPTPEPPMETVDSVADRVRKYWPGEPIEKWAKTQAWTRLAGRS